MSKTKKVLEQGQLVSLIVVSLAAAVIIIGLSLKKKPEMRVMDATAEQVEAVDTPGEPFQAESVYPEIEAVFHQKGRLDVYASNRIVTVLRDSSGWTNPEPAEYDGRMFQLNYVLHEPDRVLLGGDRLLVTGDNYLEVYDDHDFEAPVNVILEFGEGYLVGTNTGLHYYQEGKVDTILKKDMLVASMVEDAGGLWVGTLGDGLWRYDGERWQKRRLLRDNSMFDFVNTLAYNYPYLWVGTPSGIFKYNGGKWSQLFACDSSEVYEVNCILPQVFTTYIGTEQGLFVFANDSLEAVPEFEDERVLGLFKDGKDIIVATRNNGIFILNGKEEILRPEHLVVNKMNLADTR